jgi:hypothetical protein
MNATSGDEDEQSVNVEVNAVVTASTLQTLVSMHFRVERNALVTASTEQKHWFRGVSVSDTYYRPCPCATPCTEN